MARFLSRALLRHRHHAMNPTVAVPPCIHLPHRHQSSKAPKPQLIQIELGSSSSSISPSLAEGEYELALKRFDELIQRILVMKATPDWLPFVPGSSFWVPPRSSPSNVVDLVEKLNNDLSDEECLSIASLRGWPCSNFFIKENESAQPGDADVELNGPEEMGLRVQVKFLAYSENVAHSEDEEG